MKIYNYIKIVRILIIFMITFCALPAFCDTVLMHDGKEIKGVVVEDYQDRLVISTVDGEMTIMKRDIGYIAYDSEEEDYIRLANFYMDKQNYTQAYFYYEKAIELNPNSVYARQRLTFLRGVMYRKDEIKKEESIRRQEDMEATSGTGRIRSEAEETSDMLSTLEATTGLKIEIKHHIPEVLSVAADSPAEKAGVSGGDYIVSVWGRMLGYMTLRDVLTLLIKKSALEIQCVIERTISVPVNRRVNIFASTEDKIGAAFSMLIDGLTVSGIKPGTAASLSGMMNGDAVVAIDGESTRYMPLKKVINKIKMTHTGDIAFTIRRKVVIWRSQAI